MTTPRRKMEPKRPNQEPICGSEKCLFARDSHQIVEKLSQIDTRLAVIENGFVGLREFVTMKAQVDELCRGVSTLWKIVYWGAGIIGAAVLYAILSLIMKVN